MAQPNGGDRVAHGQPRAAILDCQGAKVTLAGVAQPRGADRAVAQGDDQRIVAEAARPAGITRKVTPHTLRHFFATRFLQKNGGDIATLASLLGYANISTTTHYLHPNAQRVQEMVAEM